MKKIFLIIIAAAAAHSSGFCQSALYKNKFQTTYENVYSGLKESLAWYDAPIAVSLFARKSINSSNIGEKIILSPSSYEMEFSEDNGRTGRYTLGSMDKDIIPNSIFYSRLASNILLNMFTDSEISKDSYKNIFLFKKSLIYTYVITEYVKSVVKRTRPDGEDNRSFFSGHTSTTFAAATYLWKELDDFYDNWDLTENDNSLKNVFEIGTFSVLYGWAGFVGYSRIRDNKHYLSDVIIGAAVGTLISHFVYELYNEDDAGLMNNFNLVASGNNTFGLELNVNF